jgi:hypothetical protein
MICVGWCDKGDCGKDCKESEEEVSIKSALICSIKGSKERLHENKICFKHLLQKQLLLL